jgi:hypothetical protein
MINNTANTEMTIREAFFKLDNLLGEADDAARVVDHLSETGQAALAYQASSPLFGALKEMRVIIRDTWDAAMAQESVE